jgi:phosphatidylethanolamine-binding protein (PEBP) family uncharacterized protein
MLKWGWVLVLFSGILVSQLWADSNTKPKTTFRIYSHSFKPGGAIPDQYTCKDQNISPDV